MGFPILSQEWLGSQDGGLFRSPPLAGAFGSSSLSGGDTAVAHDPWSPAFATSSSSNATSHLVPLFPSASDAALQGFARVINQSGDAGEVQIEAVDDTGVSYGPLTLSIDGHATVHFNSDDLEDGNPGKGLTGSAGAGTGDWRLTLTSDLDLEVLSYIRTTDGFLTAMHDVVPESEPGVRRVVIFNPGSNTAQVSRLRLLNTGDAEAEVTITGMDDRGMSPGSAVEVTVAAGASRTLTAAELESGGPGMTGALGDGAGKWRLTVTSAGSIHALSLLSSPTGHLTNLSTAPSNVVDGVHEVALFPSASDAAGRQGFLRVINHADQTAEITITAHDETDWPYDPLTLSLAAGAVAHFNSNDLEQGNPRKGLTGSTGAGRRRLASHPGKRLQHPGAVVHPHHGRLPDGDARRGAGGGHGPPGGDLQPREQHRPGEPSAAGEQRRAAGRSHRFGCRRPGHIAGERHPRPGAGGRHADLHGAATGVWRRGVRGRAGRRRRQVAPGGRLR